MIKTVSRAVFSMVVIFVTFVIWDLVSKYFGISIENREYVAGVIAGFYIFCGWDLLWRATE